MLSLLWLIGVGETDMKSMLSEDARRYCTQPSRDLAVDDEGFLYYESDQEHSFFVKHPLEYRRIVKLAYDILTASGINSFDEGLLWIYGWHLGASEMVRTGWAILEDMRRARGDLRSLDVAPAQHFRQDEFIELHAFLTQVIAWGWPACYLPYSGKFFVEFRSSERAFFYSNESEFLKELYSKLASWNPVKEEPFGSRVLAVAHYEAARMRMAEADFPGAIELFRSSLLADTEFYDAARGLIEALKMYGKEDEAMLIENRLAEFSSDGG
jgi:hypothetical protein